VAVANCPACGGLIEFKIGSSVVLVCDHCNSVVARTDRGLEDLGKVAALVETGSPLRRGLTGRIRGGGFRIVGRTQMRHPMGGVWDEWYAAFDNGQWAWLAEAQGKYYITTKTERHDMPPYDVLQIGGTFDSMSVVELATATLISGEGEIPFRVEPGSTYPYADLSGANRRFGTIDYSEDPPLLFEGEETTLADLGISVALEQERQTRVTVTKLSCSKCGGPLTLVAPDQAERVICPNCGAAHDVEAGSLRYLETLKRRGPQPLIALGTHGKIGNDEYIVAGFMQRSVTFDKKYYWTEYLLFAPRTKSFAWLVNDEGQWSFVVPLSAGDVTDSEPAGAAPRIESHGTTFRIFQDAVATVESVIGEFYWKVAAGETARGVDYIAPPEGISKEMSDTETSHEVNYSHAQYITPDAIEAAFRVNGLPRPNKLGTLQPAKAGGCALATTWIVLVGCLVVAAIVVAAMLPHRVVLSESYHLDQFAGSGSASAAGTQQQTTTDWSGSTTTDTSQTPATTDTSQSSGTAASSSTSTSDSQQSGGREASAVIFTKPFSLNGGHNLEIDGSTDLTNSWLYVGGDLFNEKLGLVQPFEMQLEHYEGVDDGEHWSEGSKSGSKYFSSLAAGTYSLRIEAHWDASKPPPVLNLKVEEGVVGFSGFSYLVIALIALTIPALLALRSGNESERWADAMYMANGQLNE
jgi:DNA-directed RNA polymerase subunit M/transcription elongation factor TFIIS